MVGLEGSELGEGGCRVITGTHTLLFSHDAEADRAFFLDILNLPSVDAGGGWLTFGLPPS